MEIDKGFNVSEAEAELPGDSQTAKRTILDLVVHEVSGQAEVVTDLVDRH
jgi:hypothetical protein